MKNIINLFVVIYIIPFAIHAVNQLNIGEYDKSNKIINVTYYELLSNPQLYHNKTVIVRCRIYVSDMIELYSPYSAIGSKDIAELMFIELGDKVRLDKCRIFHEKLIILAGVFISNKHNNYNKYYFKDIVSIAESTDRYQEELVNKNNINGEININTNCTLMYEINASHEHSDIKIKLTLYLKNNSDVCIKIPTNYDYIRNSHICGCDYKYNLKYYNGMVINESLDKYDVVTLRKNEIAKIAEFNVNTFYDKNHECDLPNNNAALRYNIAFQVDTEFAKHYNLTVCDIALHVIARRDYTESEKGFLKEAVIYEVELDRGTIDAN
ncbi:MAG: hypothetical protein SFY80_15220 [Verrucomicrobiota bacterium]|nr:hypothetical protein [Verrucomicrobiota bacterium]